MIRLRVLIEGDDAREFRDLDVAAVCNALGVDGIVVDVYDERRKSYEFQPGRREVFYLDEECHDFLPTAR